MKPSMSAFSGLVTLFEFLNISWASTICSFWKRNQKAKPVKGVSIETKTRALLIVIENRTMELQSL